MLTKLFEQHSQFASRSNIRGAEHKLVRQLLELREPVLIRWTVPARHALRRVLILDGHVPILFLSWQPQVVRKSVAQQPVLTIMMAAVERQTLLNPIAERVPLLNRHRELGRNEIYRGLTMVVERC